MEVGDKVKSSCQEHDTCRALVDGTIVEERENFYRFKVEWINHPSGNGGWFNEGGLILVTTAASTNPDTNTEAEKNA